MTHKLRLAVVGASVRAAAQSAVRAGFEVVGADLFADADLDGVCPITRIDNYPDDLAAWLAPQNVDAWMYTGALENYPDLVDRMASIAPLWGVSGKPLRRCRDPLQLQRVCRDADVVFPETRRLVDVSSSEEGWLGKTYHHSGGAGVWTLETDADRQRYPDAYAQRFVSGTSVAALYAVSRDQSTLLGVTEQLVSDDPFAWGYVGSLGPLRYDERLAATLERIGHVLRDPLGLVGLIGVDLIVDGDVASILEINPRSTASAEVLERAYDLSCLAALRDACSGTHVERGPRPTSCCVAKWVLFARKDVTITPAFAEWSLNEFRAGRFGDRPREGESFTIGQPIATLFIEGVDETATRNLLRVAINNAEQRLYEACDSE